MSASAPTALSFRPSRSFRAVHGVIDPLVRSVLRSPLHRLLSGSLLLLTYTGRKSGRRRTIPVMYAQDGESLVVVAGKPELKTWWRNLRGNDRLDVLVRGCRRTGWAHVLTSPDEIDAAEGRYLARSPRAAPTFDRPGRPVLVRIDLESSSDERRRP